MVAHSFWEQPANLRYRTNLFGIGLLIRLPLVLSKLNVKYDNRRFSCSSKREAPVPNKAIVFKWVFYTAHVCLHLCFYLSLVPLFTGASAAQ